MSEPITAGLTELTLILRLRGAEHDFVERKSRSDKRGWLQTAVAFANSAPIGVPAFLFVGVTDDSVPQEKPDRLEDLQKSVSRFSGDDGKKGAIVPGQLADLVVLSADYFSVPEEEIKHLESVLTVVGGRPVYAAEDFSKLAPPLPPVLPEWSPVATYGGYARPVPVAARSMVQHSHVPAHTHGRYDFGGCLCWAF